MIRIAFIVALTCVSSACYAVSFPIVRSGVEPDDYAEKQALTFVNPSVGLFIFNMGQQASPDPLGFPTEFGRRIGSVIPVTALTNDTINNDFYTSTGTKTFGHAGVSFNTDSSAIGMRYYSGVHSVSIDAIGHSNLSPSIDVLEAYDRNRRLIARVQSRELDRFDVETLSIVGRFNEIHYAIVFPSADGSPFGRYDNLRFSSLVVPEPSALLLFCAAIPAFCVARRMRLLRR